MKTDSTTFSSRFAVEFRIGWIGEGFVDWFDELSAERFPEGPPFRFADPSLPREAGRAPLRPCLLIFRPILRRQSLDSR